MKVPNRVILSRKGFDQGAGKCSSPILDDKLFSVPIPESPEPHPETGLKFSDILLSDEWLANFGVTDLDALIRHLRPRARVLPKFVHLDPDIRPTLRTSLSEVNRPMSFGQSENALGELNNCCVQEGDLFLFFGRFERISISGGKWMFDGRRKHILWGWLQIGEIIDLSHDKIPAWATNHPHVLHRISGQRPYGTGRNVLYKAADELSFQKGKGAGTFPFKRDSHELTSHCSDCSRCDWWDLPKFFFEEGCARNRKKNPCGCEHGNKDLSHGYARANYTGRGQEFVFLTRHRERQFEEWLNKVFSGLEKRS